MCGEVGWVKKMTRSLRWLLRLYKRQLKIFPKHWWANVRAFGKTSLPEGLCVWFAWGKCVHKNIVGCILFPYPSAEIRHTLQLQSLKASGIKYYLSVVQWKPKEGALTPVFVWVRSQEGLLFMFHKCEVVVDVMPKIVVFVSNFNENTISMNSSPIFLFLILSEVIMLAPFVLLVTNCSFCHQHFPFPFLDSFLISLLLVWAHAPVKLTRLFQFHIFTLFHFHTGD